MSRLRQAGVIFLVMMVFFSTTGFTVWHHICGCRNAEPVMQTNCCEPVQETASCCAHENEGTGVEDPSECNTCGNEHGDGCKDIPVYFKASIVAVPLVQKIVLPELTREVVAEIPFLPDLTCKTNEPLVFSGHEKPPRKTGKQLVFFLSQLRIPLSA